MSYSDFDNNISAAHLAKMRERETAEAKRTDMCQRWQESERILGFLRPIQTNAEPLSEEVIRNWYATVESRPFATATGVPRPSEYFHTRFPKQFEVYGPAMLEEEHLNRVHMSAQWTPVLLNTDFAAAILGGDYALGHQTVYYRPEARFYFYDVRVDAFCPTTEEKIELLASNHFVKAVEASGPVVNTQPLFDDFRRSSMLSEITSKAKTILEADRSFFEGSRGKVRFIDGYRLKPLEEPTYRMFIKTAVARRPGARMTMSEVYVRYLMFCRENHFPALPKEEFRPAIAMEIEEIFDQRSRNDVPDESGKQQHGWKNLICLPA